MRTLELRRHAKRDPDVDRLSADGRAQAEDVGRGLDRAVDVVFVSPAERAAETAAWILRGAGQQLPEHAVIPGLAGKDPSGGSPDAMAAGIRTLLGRVPEGGFGLAVGHTPFVERTVIGLTGEQPEPFAECEGIRVSREGDGALDVREVRLSR
jgi:phosphohistidine phosphatase SixA